MNEQRKVWVVLSQGCTKYDEVQVEGVYLNEETARAALLAEARSNRSFCMEESTLSDEVVIFNEI